MNLTSLLIYICSICLFHIALTGMIVLFFGNPSTYSITGLVFFTLWVITITCFGLLFGEWIKTP